MDKQRIVEMKKTVSEVDEHKRQLRQIIQQNQIDSLKDTNGSQLEQLSHNKVYSQKKSFSNVKSTELGKTQSLTNRVG